LAWSDRDFESDFSFKTCEKNVMDPKTMSLFLSEVSFERKIKEYVDYDYGKMSPYHQQRSGHLI